MQIATSSCCYHICPPPPFPSSLLITKVALLSYGEVQIAGRVKAELKITGAVIMCLTFIRFPLEEIRWQVTGGHFFTMDMAILYPYICRFCLSAFLPVMQFWSSINSSNAQPFALSDSGKCQTLKPNSRNWGEKRPLQWATLLPRYERVK